MTLVKPHTGKVFVSQSVRPEPPQGGYPVGSYEARLAIERVRSYWRMTPAQRKQAGYDVVREDE